MADKKTLRSVYLEKRLFLSKEEHLRRNSMLLERLFQCIDFTQVNFLHTFLSITEKKEVDTFSIIEKASFQHPDIGIIISKTLPKGELQHYHHTEETIIKPNNWGIPEPISGHLAELDEIDLVLVPLITFDKQGHRIGYGKGYYDRFLKKVPQAKKIGISLAPPLDVIPYADEMDVKMDMCITPFRSYEF